MDSRVDDPVETGRTILAALYLFMLGVCFLVPIFFYVRMHCDERRNRHLRELEIAGMTQAMNESQAQQREESRAARRKYREERRARILQLFTPVRLILTEENFIHFEISDETSTTQNCIEATSTSTDEGNELSKGLAELDLDPAEKTSTDSFSNQAEGSCFESDDIDEFILIPKPGLPHGTAMYEFDTNTNSFLIANNHDKTNQQHDDIELRRVPNECSICLCEYKLGSDVVWSSNPKCDHVFHTSCIEQWLMKQRDGSLCPCCRRDFVVDPFDFGSGEREDLEKGNSGAFSSGVGQVLSASTSTGSRNSETSPIADDVEETVVAMFLAASMANSMTRIDESDGSTIDVPTQVVANDADLNTSSNNNSRT